MTYQKLKDFEFQIFRQLQNLPESIHSKKILLAVSGGKDSMVLLHLMSQLKARFPFELVVGHVVHQTSGELSPFRQQAKECVQKACQRYQLRMFCNDVEKAEGPMLSDSPNEDEWRQFRWFWLEKWQKEQGCQLIATAHHKPDQLETRLIRLIRGTGLKGLAAMSVFEENRLRPLLNCENQEIYQYATEEEIGWVEDPNNQDEHFLRNWLRNNWLKALESYRPGAQASLTRSLETIVQEAQTFEQDRFSFGSFFWQEADGKKVISRAQYMGAPLALKKRLLAEYLMSLKIHRFTQGQLEEVIKRLDTRQKDLNFRVAGCEWRINAEQIVGFPL